jgi:hypothetical protein
MRIFSLLFLLLALYGCDNNYGDTTMSPGMVEISIGWTGQQFLEHNGLPAKGNVDEQPAGLIFYEVDWSTKLRGKVRLEHGKHSFVVPHALGVMGTEDVERLESGIETYSITAGISDQGPILHDEARKLFLDFIQTLTDLGWKPVYFYDDPRLAGKDAFRYYEEEDTYNIPPDYRPTLEQWMRMDSPYWSLYAEDVFLDITFRRDRKRMESDKPGAYLLSLTLTGKEAQAKKNFQGEHDRANWMDLWEEKIQGLKKQRYAKEDMLRKRGFTIDTDYEDPKIHPDDPVEP